MKAYRRAKCSCGYDTLVTDGRTDTQGFSLKQSCPKCKGKLRLSADWIVRGQHNGERIWQNCGPSKKAAEIAIGKILEAKYTGAPLPKKESVITWEEAWVLLEKQNLATNSKKAYSVVKNSFGNMFSGNLANIKPAMVNKFIEARQAEGIAPATIALALGCIKRLYTLAMADLDARVEEYPNLLAAARNISKIKLPTYNNEKNDFWTLEEVHRLIDAAPKKLALFIKIMIETGLRPNNVYSLRFDDITETGTLVFEPEDMKAKKRFITSISKELMRDIRIYQMETGYREWLFPTHKGTKPVTHLKHHWVATCAKAGLEGTPHKLRHSFASNLVKAKVPLIEVSKLLGHSKINTTMRYAHIDRETLDNTLSEYQKLIRGNR